MCIFFREVQYLQKLIEYNDKRRKKSAISDKVSNISIFPVRNMSNITGEKFAKINKDFIYPNVKLYKLITVVEYLFDKHCRSSNSFDLDDLISSETKFIFQCKEHANEAVDMLAYVI